MNSETNRPPVMQPEVMEPDVMEPDVMEPDAMQPGTMQPGPMQPDVAPPSGCPHMVLAMAYILDQLWADTYEPEIGLCRGTIFPGLDKPFIGEEMSNR